MATGSPRRGRGRRPPLDNTKLIADIVTLVKAGISMMETSHEAGITFNISVNFVSEVEERRVRRAKTTTELSTRVYGDISFSSSARMTPSANEIGVPAWIVDVGTRANGPISSILNWDDERNLPGHAAELAERLPAHVVPYNHGLRIFIPITANE